MEKRRWFETQRKQPPPFRLLACAACCLSHRGPASGRVEQEALLGGEAPPVARVARVRLELVRHVPPAL